MFKKEFLKLYKKAQELWGFKAPRCYYPKIIHKISEINSRCHVK